MLKTFMVHLESCGVVGRVMAAEGKPVVLPLQNTAQPKSCFYLLTATLWAGRLSAPTPWMPDQAETPVPSTDVMLCCS